MNDVLDTDLAIMIVTAPLWLSGFLLLAMVGAVGDLMNGRRANG